MGAARGWDSAAPVSLCIQLVFWPTILSAPHAAQHRRSQHAELPQVPRTISRHHSGARRAHQRCQPLRFAPLDGPTLEWCPGKKTVSPTNLAPARSLSLPRNFWHGLQSPTPIKLKHGDNRPIVISLRDSALVSRNRGLSCVQASSGPCRRAPNRCVDCWTALPWRNVPVIGARPSCRRYRLREILKLRSTQGPNSWST